MANPIRQYQQISNPEVIFRVQAGRCVPPGYPAAGKSVNGLNDEQLAELDLRVYVAPPPAPPTLEQYQAQKLSQVRQEAAFHIEETYPPFYQRNVALGLYAEDTMTTDIASVITESNRVEDAIDAVLPYDAESPVGTTGNEGVDTAYATLSWPVIGGA